MNVTMKNNATGKIIEAKTGFSWTTFFFGWFVPMFRGDLKWFLLMFISNIFITYFLSPYGAFAVDIVFSFIYNGEYIKGLKAKGYEPVDQRSSDILAANKL